jgi:hypothetical protein
MTISRRDSSNMRDQREQRELDAHKKQKAETPVRSSSRIKAVRQKLFSQ